MRLRLLPTVMMVPVVRTALRLLAQLLVLVYVLVQVVLVQVLYRMPSGW